MSYTTEEIKTLLKNYEILCYNNTLTGSYLIEETTAVKVQDDEQMMEMLHKAIEGLVVFRNGEKMREEVLKGYRIGEKHPNGERVNSWYKEKGVEIITDVINRIESGKKTDVL